MNANSISDRFTENSIIQSHDTLTLRAFSDLQEFFMSKDHSPNAEMMDGLYNTIDNLTLQLHGKLDSKFYICSLDPGVGKTSAIKMWISNYLRKAHEYENKGVILFFDRHEEIESFLDDCDLPQDSFGVLVGDSTEKGKSLNSKGVGKDNIESALVLFTTKQQIIRRTLNKASFNGVSVFHYLGNPRPVRIWDETMIVGRPLTVNASDILELVGTTERQGNVETSTILRRLANTLYDCADGVVIEIPDFDSDLKAGFRWETSNMRRTADTLDLLSGRIAEVKVEGKGRVALDCIESLPSDLQPCLVTDASARFRGTYKLYEQYNGEIVRLAPESSCKRFDPLSVHVLHRSTSKTTYSNPKEIDKVASDVAEVIMSRPGEEFLVVVTVGNYRKMTRAIFDKLAQEHHPRIQFLTWGRHTATNKFISIPNVIITSLLYYRPADYIASMRASAVYPASEGFIPKEEFRDFQRREIGHHLLQVANRGKMRKCIGNLCPEARLWIMSSKMIGLEKIIEEVFLGCSQKPWQSVTPNETKGIREQIVDHIQEELKKGLGSLSWSNVRKTFGVTSQSNFRKLYLQNENFLRLCDSSGLLIDSDSYTFSLNPFM